MPYSNVPPPREHQGENTLGCYHVVDFHHGSPQSDISIVVRLWLVNPTVSIPMAKQLMKHLLRGRITGIRCNK